MRDKAGPQRFYDTLSVEQIIAHKPSIADQAHVYIWCLATHVDWGFAVAAAWGAEPITLLTWKKPGLGVGRFRCNTEHVLVSRVGPRAGNPFGQGGRHAQATDGTLFEWPRGKHSEKPQEFYDLVERLSPAPRLEMYARHRREGWDVWGAEADGSVIRIPLPARGKQIPMEPCLSDSEMAAQARRCSCQGTNDLCQCQNVPDAKTIANRSANHQGKLCI